MRTDCRAWSGTAAPTRRAVPDCVLHAAAAPGAGGGRGDSDGSPVCGSAVTRHHTETGKLAAAFLAEAAGGGVAECSLVMNRSIQPWATADAASRRGDVRSIVG